jgi:acyl dehydratase
MIASTDDSLVWEDIPVGHTHAWDITVTQDAVNAYCDGAQDYNPWYGPSSSPFGWPVVPPMLISRLCRFTLAPLGKMTGWIQVLHRNEILVPVAVGSTLAFVGEVSAKERRRGKPIVSLRAIATNASGVVVFEQTSEYVCRERS